MIRRCKSMYKWEVLCTLSSKWCYTEINYSYYYIWQDLVYGVAYKIAEKDVTEVIEYLDYREKDGYEQLTVTFYPHDPAFCPFELKIYVADKNNPFYVGPAPLEDIAYQILNSVGPSGRNDDYLFQLANTMRTLVPEVQDDHLYQLEYLVKNIQHTNNK